jgi:hypothetical protein
MTCEEFERVLEESEGDQTTEQESHLISCSSCLGLVADFDAISEQARLLGNTDEPSPRVWNSIEIQLRQEGLIRGPESAPFLVPKLPRRWPLAWLIPAAAILLVTFGVVRHERSQIQSAQPAIADTSIIADVSNVDDRQLLKVVSTRSPAMRASYEASLRDVNSYIRDAEESVKIDPNDEQAQLYLMNAYEQKSMVYEMALDRSLP